MGSRTLRIGVVGAGARGALPLRAETPHNNAEIVCVAEPSPHAHERVTRALKREIRIVSSHESWTSSEIDAAFVLSPDDTHEDVTCDLLTRGIAVYLEKPLAITVEGATRILQTAYETQTPLYVGHNMRHMSVVTILKEVVDSGTIGEVRAIWCRHFVGNGGDYYFKDWHAQRNRVNSLLLQKGAHDIDVMHWLAGSYTRNVVGMGSLGVYNTVESRRDNSDELMTEWFDYGAWPPEKQQNLNPTIDVEDLSMILMQLDNGILASYQQCHYTPDYWRNYTVIGTRGRAENFGDTGGGVVRVWCDRVTYDPHPSIEIPIGDDAGGHQSADQRTVDEFIEFVRNGTPTQTSPIGAWYAAVTGAEAAYSLRHGSIPRTITDLPSDLVTYFSQPASPPTVNEEP
ncbi:MAG: Gfo/Idh/MocA family oxidoreductase [Actinomycetaceae bacterium]|nr:Gfo/Idh/MocA family oxidoreductase [Actinomycetaceae bacterium]